MQSQLVCAGCRNLLLYPRGSTNVCCAVCSTITPVPPPGMEMAQLVCGGCRTLLLHVRGATNVRCSCCNTINLTRAASRPTEWEENTILSIKKFQSKLQSTCCIRRNNRIKNRQGQTFGARGFRVLCSVPPARNETPNQMAHINCGRCHITLMYPFGAPSVKCAVCHFVTDIAPRNPIHMQRPSGPVPPPSSTSAAHSHTVVVENPMSVDESGKLVSNVVVGVTREK